MSNNNHHRQHYTPVVLKTETPTSEKVKDYALAIVIGLTIVVTFTWQLCK